MNAQKYLTIDHWIDFAIQAHTEAIWDGFSPLDTSSSPFDTLTEHEYLKKVDRMSRFLANHFYQQSMGRDQTNIYETFYNSLTVQYTQLSLSEAFKFLQPNEWTPFSISAEPVECLFSRVLHSYLTIVRNPSYNEDHYFLTNTDEDRKTGNKDMKFISHILEMPLTRYTHPSHPIKSGFLRYEGIRLDKDRLPSWAYDEDFHVENDMGMFNTNNLLLLMDRIEKKTQHYIRINTLTLEMPIQNFAKRPKELDQHITGLEFDFDESDMKTHYKSLHA
jgi:hypothetical protein